MSMLGWDMGPDVQASYKGTYTPTWTSTGTAPSLGNGTLLGQFTYLQNQGLLVVAIDLLWGSTTTGGTGAWGLSLPSGFSTAALFQAGAGFANDTSTSTNYRVVGEVGPSSTGIFPVAVGDSTSLAGVASPMTWATGDRLVLSAAVLLA